MKYPSSLSLLKATINATGYGILVLDSNQIICRYNKRFEELWDIPHNILISKEISKIKDFILSQIKKPDLIVDKLNQMRAHPELEMYDFIELKNGKVFEYHYKPQWLQDNIIGKVISFRDITTQRYNELALKQSEEKYRSLFDNAKDGMILAEGNSDGRANKIIAVNDIACQWIGHTKEELLTMTTGEIEMLSGLTQCFPLYNKQNLSDKNLLYETECTTGDGKQIILEVNVHRFELNGRMVSLGIGRDITERKKAEAQLARIDKLNLVGEMAAGIGHEVRNPMTTVRGFLQMLSNKAEGYNYKDYYNLMIEELDRANSIISEFISMAKDKKISLQKFDLNSIINSLLPLIEAEALMQDKVIKPELAALPEILLDKKELQQLILNLVRNGLEAMNAGGCVTIKTYLDKDDVVLAIVDEGPGISPDIMEKLGTPFFTTKENGTGLGLAVCYSIAARQNANITIDTNEKGTTFFVRFKQET